MIAQPVLLAGAHGSETRADRVGRVPSDASAATPSTPWERGRAALQAGRAQEALTFFQAAQQLAPKNPDVSNNLGVCLAKLQRHDEALQAFRAALTLDPSHRPALKNLARLLRARGSADAVIPLLSALEPALRDAVLWQELGAAYDAIGDRGQAIEAYEHAWQLAPDAAELAYNLGCLHALNDHEPRAIEWLRRATMLDPRFAKAHDALGQLYERQGLLTLAKEAYFTAHQRDPAHPRFLHHLIRLFIRLEEFAHAQAAVDCLLLLDHSSREALSYEAVALLQTGSTDRAILAFTRLVERSPKDSAAWNNLAVACYRVGDWQRAREALAMAKALAPDNANVHTNLGVLEARAGHWESAQEAFDAALRVEPDFAPARHNVELLEASRSDRVVPHEPR
jgi:Flp pilus assembly protein TadD